MNLRFGLIQSSRLAHTNNGSAKPNLAFERDCREARQPLNFTLDVLGASELLSLDSPRWSELSHAYGPASDIPPLLSQLSSLPTSENNKEPWFYLWSALAHQGDVYPASFAAVPHVVLALASAPDKAEFTYFQFPAWVEVCRKKSSVEIPKDLQTAYFAALSQLPALVAAAATREWEPGFLSCALSAIAAAKGQLVSPRQCSNSHPRLLKNSWNGSFNGETPNPSFHRTLRDKAAQRR